jgi:hypothetical protein
MGGPSGCRQKSSKNAGIYEFLLRAVKWFSINTNLFRATPFVLLYATKANTKRSPHHVAVGSGPRSNPLVSIRCTCCVSVIGRLAHI